MNLDSAVRCAQVPTLGHFAGRATDPKVSFPNKRCLCIAEGIVRRGGLVRAARRQEPTDAVCRDRRHACEAHSDWPARRVGRHDLARGCDDIGTARQLELQPDETSCRTSSTDGVEAHAGPTDVRSPTKVWIPVKESIHEQVDLAPGVSAALAGSRLLSRITRRCMHNPTCRINT